MNYTLHQLRIYLKVTETLSITKTAEKLNLTQPAISIQLKNFQDQFDYPLIEIINKKTNLIKRRGVGDQAIARNPSVGWFCSKNSAK